jgi:hypothetical protein
MRYAQNILSHKVSPSGLLFYESRQLRTMASTKMKVSTRERRGKVNVAAGSDG